MCTGRYYGSCCYKENEIGEYHGVAIEQRPQLHLSLPPEKISSTKSWLLYVTTYIPKNNLL